MGAQIMPMNTSWNSYMSTADTNEVISEHGKKTDFISYKQFTSYISYTAF
jgi:hypothetical protein